LRTIKVTDEKQIKIDIDLDSEEFDINTDNIEELRNKIKE